MSGAKRPADEALPSPDAKEARTTRLPPEDQELADDIMDGNDVNALAMRRSNGSNSSHIRRLRLAVSPCKAFASSLGSEPVKFPSVEPSIAAAAVELSTQAGRFRDVVPVRPPSSLVRPLPLLR